MRFLATLFITSPLSLCIAFSAENAAPPSNIAPSDMARQIELLIAQLGANSYAARQDAVGRLEKLDRAALHQLKQTLAKTNDPEVRLRAQGLIDKISESFDNAEHGIEQYFRLTALSMEHGINDAEFSKLIKHADSVLKQVERLLPAPERALKIGQTLYRAGRMLCDSGDLAAMPDRLRDRGTELFDDATSWLAQHYNANNRDAATLNLYNEAAAMFSKMREPRRQ
jgi:hypothetical protein